MGAGTSSADGAGQQRTVGGEEDNPEGATGVTQGDVASDPLAEVSEVEGQEVVGGENVEGDEDEPNEEELDEEEDTDEDEYLARFINRNPVSSTSTGSTGSV